MNWVCTICGTVNDEDETVCFACDYTRSEEEIKTARREAAIHRFQKKYLAVLDGTISVLRIVSLVCIIAMSVLTAMILIFRITGSQLNSIFDILMRIVQTGRKNVIELGFVVFAVADSVSGGAGMLLAERVAYILDLVTAHFAHCSQVVSLCGQKAINHLETMLTTVIVPLVNKVLAKRF